MIRALLLISALVLTTPARSQSVDMEAVDIGTMSNLMVRVQAMKRQMQELKNELSQERAKGSQPKPDATKEEPADTTAPARASRPTSSIVERPEPVRPPAPSRVPDLPRAPAPPFRPTLSDPPK